MSVTGLLASGLLLLVIGLAVAAPLLRQRHSNRLTLTTRERERALAYYERVLTNVRDLDEDFATGKIAPEEYEAERGVWVERGIKLLKLLDDLNANQHIVASDADDAAIDAAIDDALAQEQPNALQATREMS